MLDLLNGYINYIKIGLLVFIACGLFYGGFHVGNLRYLEYKASVEATAKIQEAKVESITKQQELVTKGITNEYEAKLAAVKSFYGRVQLNPSGGSMSGISAAPKGPDAETAYPILARPCTETTIQLTSLQDWVNQQVGIK